MLDGLIHTVTEYNKISKENEIILLFFKKIMHILHTVSKPAASLINEKNTSLLNKELEGKNIALVGNSPILKDKKYGNFIDEHIVIRLNNGVLEKNFDKNITGIKTDFWGTGAINSMTNSDIINEIQEYPNKYKKILMGLSDDTGKYGYEFFKLYFRFKKYRKQELYYTKNNLYQELVDICSEGCDRIYKPSTGFTTFNTLYEGINYNKLNLFGFSFDSTHLHNKEAAKNNFHNFYKEEEIILEIINKEKNIKLYK